MKKFFATILALVMALSVMSVTAFATTPDLSSHEYKAFQIFSGTQLPDDTTGKLADVKWGAGINGPAMLQALKDDDTLGDAFADCENAADVAAVMKTWTDSSNEAKAFAKLAYANKTGEGIDCENGVTPLEAGYYLVVDVTEPAADAENFVSNLALLQMTKKGEFQIATKVDVPQVDKKIVDDNGAKVSSNEASIGDDVQYEVTGTLPTGIEDYNTYFYQFTDTMSEGLSYNNDMVITVDGEDVTSDFTITAENNVITVSIADLFAVGTITKDTKVVLSYSAKLNEKAEIAGDGNTNKVDLEYSNNPNESGTPGNPDENAPTGKTPEVEVVTYTTELTITKTDDQDQILTGAEFQLTGTGVNVVITTGQNYVVDADGDYWKLNDGTYTTTDPATEGVDATKYASTSVKYDLVNVVTYDTSDENVNVKAFVKEDGTLTFSGLGAGEYTLTETTTPAGYNTIQPINFTVSFDHETNKFQSNNPNVAVDGTTNTLATTVVNSTGSTLPETGGIGTRIFYAVGGAMLVGATVVLVAKKRMESEN